MTHFVVPLLLGLLGVACTSAGTSLGPLPWQSTVTPAAGTAPSVDAQLLAAVCGASNVASPAGFPGCAPCPRFTAAGLAGGQGPATIIAVWRGHFSRADADELVIALTGCEGHGDDYGGTALLERSNGGWRQSRYFAGRGLPPCQAAAIDGRTQLLCGHRHFSQGAEIDTLSVEDFGPLGRSTLLVRAMDTTGVRGWVSAHGANAPTMASLIDFAWADVNRDGAPDAVAHVESRGRKAVLTFLYKDEAFEPTPHTREILAELE